MAVPENERLKEQLKYRCPFNLKFALQTFYLIVCKTTNELDSVAS